MLDRELAKLTEQGTQAIRCIRRLGPGVRADPQLIVAASEHRVAEQEGCLLGQPQRDLVIVL
ncbi:MAG: hypothetical protein WAL63_16320 [Solirubrobacteraceae bacterium]